MKYYIRWKSVDNQVIVDRALLIVHCTVHFRKGGYLNYLENTHKIMTKVDEEFRQENEGC